MAKKKSKTQKYKKNLKRKMNKSSGKVTTKASNVMNVDEQKKSQLREALAKEYEKSLEMPKKNEEHQIIVEKDKINYNVVMAYESEHPLQKQNHSKNPKEKILIETRQIIKKEKKTDEKTTNNSPLETKLKKLNEKPDDNDQIFEKTKEIIKKELTNEEIKKIEEIAGIIHEQPQKPPSKEEHLNDISSPFIDFKKNTRPNKKSYFELVMSRIKKNYAEYKMVAKKKKEQESYVLPKLKSKNIKTPHTVKAVNKEKYDPYELKTENSKRKSKNIFINILLSIHHNSHIIFNSIGILLFIIMIIGLVRIHVYETSTIIYVSCIIGFLLFVAVSFNKYLSGKFLTLILSVGMICVIYYMQYTYDFIKNLNTSLYEYKTYYVVTFDNGGNKSIYNINNKKVGLLKDNCINIERKLNTKIEPVYVEYEDINSLFNDFYEQHFRAILVNENQYKYLQNNIQNDRTVKILYEFEANAKK